MSFRLLLVLLIALATLLGCSKKVTEGLDGDISSVENSQRESTKYLAYEYHLSIEVKKSDLKKEYDKLTNACSSDRTNDCTILEAKISMNEHYSDADIRLRIKPPGVTSITKIASSGGEILSQGMKVEDLAKEIVDNEQRTKMLTMQRDRLLALEKNASGDITSLIKIASELSNIQSQLESSTGRDAHLLQRTNMDIVNIHYSTENDSGFWQPIFTSANHFTDDLSNGISEAISYAAFILPGFVIFLILLFVTKFLWRKFKSSVA